ncbi:MAG TPA: SDR family NAD(P)-dependent oxidoreductase [Acidimicrobiales bacterium]|nr:SDR family NAD(P)-dependent oxidoreductase [Acidimicrobiales bacterium]
MRVDGSRVLVTGASSGIGAALARLLAERGATVGLVARRRDRLEEVLAECRANAPASAMWVADLADTPVAETVALQAWEQMGPIDCLVNNAGVPMRRHTLALDQESVEWVMRVNFLAPARMTLALLPKMIDNGSGMIVNVSSVAGRLGNANEAAYSASKFALCGWSEAIAVDLWDTPVEIRLVNPGPIDTEIWDLPGNDDPLYDGPKISAREMAEGIVAAMEGERFEHYVPDMKAIIESKTSDPDPFIEGMAAMLRSSRPLEEAPFRKER